MLLPASPKSPFRLVHSEDFEYQCLREEQDSTTNRIGTKEEAISTEVVALRRPPGGAWPATSRAGSYQRTLAYLGVGGEVGVSRYWVACYSH